jgi:hypothetical protein
MTWTSVSTLSVVTESGQQQGEIELGHWIGLVVLIQPTNEHGDPVTIDHETLVKNTWLIDYVDESRLNWNGTSGWCYKEASRPFAILGGSQPGGLQTTVDGVPVVKFDVTCYSNPPKPRTKSIGVQVQTSSGNTIKSSQSGTYHSSVQITAK